MCTLATTIRLQKVSARQQKPSYKYLNDTEKRYIKAWEQNEQAQKDLDRFWTTAPRTERGAVDWNSMDEKTLDLFEQIYKKSESTRKTMSRLEDNGLDGDKTIDLFRQTNRHGTSFC